MFIVDAGQQHVAHYASQSLHHKGSYLGWDSSYKGRQA